MKEKEDEKEKQIREWIKGWGWLRGDTGETMTHQGKKKWRNKKMKKRKKNIHWYQIWDFIIVK